MDEILASIRRIIENSDDDMAHNINHTVPQDRGSQAEARGESISRLDTGTGGSNPQDDGFTAGDETSNVALFSSGEADDLAVSLQRELEADTVSAWPRADAPFAGFDDARDEAAADAAQPSAPARPEREEAPMRAASERAEPAFRPANTDSRRMQDFRSAVIEDLEGAVEREGGIPLVSGRTGELVGASFEELAQAIRQGELRSLEDMAQELLRPMLQDWLDDNLPNLVERLVREEIERVARGGRR